MRRLFLALCLVALPAQAKRPPRPALHRSQHWTDQLQSTDEDGNETRTRAIRNWSNWRAPGRQWQPTDPSVEATIGRPDDWEGDAWDHTHESRRAPLQVYYRNAASADGRGAVVTIRRSRRPKAWQRFVALGVNDGVSPTFGPGPNTVRYIALWPGTNLRYRSGPHVLSQEILINNKAIAPLFYEFGLRKPVTFTVAIDELLGSFELFDDLGKSVFGTSVITAHDSATDGPNLDGSNPIRLSITDRGNRLTRRVIRVQPNAVDMASAVGQVVIR